MSLRPLPEGFKELLATPDLPLLGPESRPGVLSEAEVSQTIETALVKRPQDSSSRELVHCVALLWHDHLDAAHRIAQDIGTPDGSWLHGIMHRREPDYWNAKYWFRRAGAHPAFAELAARAEPLADKPETKPLTERLFKSGKWDSLAFVDAVEASLGTGGSTTDRKVLQQLQALELETALAWFLA